MCIYFCKEKCVSVIHWTYTINICLKSLAFSNNGPFLSLKKLYKKYVKLTSYFECSSNCLLCHTMFICKVQVVLKRALLQQLFDFKEQNVRLFFSSDKRCFLF